MKSALGGTRNPHRQFSGRLTSSNYGMVPWLLPVSPHLRPDSLLRARQRRAWKPSLMCLSRLLRYQTPQHPNRGADRGGGWRTIDSRKEHSRIRKSSISS